jgi:DNA polymerase-3 subunit epsilon
VSKQKSDKEKAQEDSSRHWMNQAWVGFDTETTGTNPQDARILQAAIVTYDPTGVMVEEDRVVYVDPGVEIPAEASAIHGITKEKLEAEQAFPARAGIDWIARILFGRSVQRGYPIVIYNTPYDWPLLMAERHRHGIEVSEKQPMFLDPLVIDRALDKYRKGSRKLEDTARLYGVKLDGAHGAQADATATLGIMQALVRRFPELKKHSLAEMQRLQAAWYREWRDHLNGYWQRTGKAERVTGEWPGAAVQLQAKGAA